MQQYLIEKGNSIPLFPELTRSDNITLSVSEEGEVIDTEEEFVFDIKFRNKSDFKKLATKIVNTLTSELNTSLEKYVFSFLEAENGVRVFLTQTQYNYPNMTDDENTDVSALDNQSTHFMIDIVPAVNLDKAKVPSYKRAIKDMLDVTTEYKKQKSDVNKCLRPTRPTPECFNCGYTDHELRDCPKPRNNARINRAKKMFSFKQERYHVDIEQRFAHLRPGKISEKLQLALGLQKGELPFFFYRMRLLGYPPGWLEDAKVSRSGLSLFNSDGAKVLQSDDDDNDDSEKINDKYNISKIIEFPGFNKDPGINFYDDYKHHNVPPLNLEDMKQEFIKTLGVNRVVHGYKRRKLKNLPTTNPDSSEHTSTVEVTDMELEDECSELLTKAHASSMQLKQLHESDDLLTSHAPPLSLLEAERIILGEPVLPQLEGRSQSPTLADLEEQQLKLLLELKADISTNSTEQEDSLVDEVIALETSHCDLDQKDRQETKCMSPSTPVSLVGNKMNIITASHMGTPVLKFSPYEKLPDGVNFKVGVSDVINFENLPDSTGKYEQMKVVIKKVRNIITQLHNEDN